MSKKIISLLLIVLMVGGLIMGCGQERANETVDVGDQAKERIENEINDANDTDQDADVKEEDEYAEKLSFTVLSLDDTEDFMTYPLVVEATEKFNFEFQIQHVAWDSWNETVRTLAATNSLPEVVAWYDLNYAEYISWVDQGVWKALPDDLSKYPNLKKITEDRKTLFDYFKVDGKLYAFPKIGSGNPYNNYEVYFVVYRKDWANEMGKDFDPVQEMTWDEFIDYLDEVKEKDPAGLGDKLIPFELEHGGSSWMEFIRRFFNPGVQGFQKIDGKYEWTTKDESTLEGIKVVKQLYDNGIFARDSYAYNTEMGKDRFFGGRGAVYFTNFNMPKLQEAVLNIKKSNPEFEETDLGILAVTNPNGEYLVTESSDWWAAFAFSHNCRDEVMHRWLAVGNWLLEEEQVEKYAYGKPGEDWIKDEDGKVTLNWTEDDVVQGGPKDYIINQRYFQKFFILEGLDVWLEGNPAYSEYLHDIYETALKTFEKNPRLTPIDYDFAYFSGENKIKYADLLREEASKAIVEAVVSDNPEQVWNDFIKANEQTANLILEELNKEFGE